MKKPHIEELASHDDPESCASPREGAGEALTGARVGRVLSRENRYSQGADAGVLSGRQHERVRHGKPERRRWTRHGMHSFVVGRVTGCTCTASARLSCITDSLVVIGKTSHARGAADGSPSFAETSHGSGSTQGCIGLAHIV